MKACGTRDREGGGGEGERERESESERERESARRLSVREAADSGGGQLRGRAEAGTHEKGRGQPLDGEQHLAVEHVLRKVPPVLVVRLRHAHTVTSDGSGTFGACILCTECAGVFCARRACGSVGRACTRSWPRGSPSSSIASRPPGWKGHAVLYSGLASYRLRFVSNRTLPAPARMNGWSRVTRVSLMKRS